MVSAKAVGHLKKNIPASFVYHHVKIIAALLCPCPREQRHGSLSSFDTRYDSIKVIVGYYCSFGCAHREDTGGQGIFRWLPYTKMLPVIYRLPVDENSADWQ